MNKTTDHVGRWPVQESLFGDAEDRIQHPVPPPDIPDLDDVRRRLHELLATARAADRMPWDARRAKTYQTIFPQMASWLPAAEANQLRVDFAQEIARLILAV